MSSAKETFKELGFEQFHFENDENSITIGYKKEKPFVSVELINFYYYKTEKCNSNGSFLYDIRIHADWYFYDFQASKYESVGGIGIDMALLNAINKQIEELKQEVIK